MVLEICDCIRTVRSIEIQMDTYLMKKAMIEAAVTHGLKEVEEDPERSVRRLTDLGRQFSKNRFQDQIFSIMQELLNNEDSAYYDMVHNLLANSCHDHLKKFGINVGYMSWAYGADKLRKEEDALHVQLPWGIMFRYNSDPSSALTPAVIEQLIQQGQDLGIYAWMIRQCGRESDSYELLTILEKYKDSAFLWIKQDGRLTAAQIQMLRVCQNTLISLPVEDPETQLTTALLRDQKIPFAIHGMYGDDYPASQEDEQMLMERVLSTQTAIFLTIADDHTNKHLGSLCYESRLRQEYPAVLIDYYDDGRKISEMLVNHSTLLEIGEDLAVLRGGTCGERFPVDLPLTDALRKIMPAYPA